MTRQRHSQRGATLLESALTMLVFFMLLLGIFEFGRAYNMYQVMTDAAREGARFSVAPYTQTSTLPSTTDVSDKVTSFLNTANIKGPDVKVDVNQSLTRVVNGRTIYFTQVNVQAPFTFYSVFSRFGTLTLKTKVEMRNETN